jgi:hypothetical protein
MAVGWSRRPPYDGAAIHAWWTRWNAGRGAQGVAAPRVAEWRRVVADADHADPLVQWWMAGGHGPVPRAGPEARRGVTGAIGSRRNPAGRPDTFRTLSATF